MRVLVYRGSWSAARTPDPFDRHDPFDSHLSSLEAGRSMLLSPTDKIEVASIPFLQGGPETFT